jgi:hypothetical protein
MKYVLASLLFVGGLAHGASCTNLPVGATKLGYTTQVFYNEPNMSDVSDTDTDSTSKWYPGTFASSVSHNVQELQNVAMKDGDLAIGLGGGISSETHSAKAGGIPFLSGAKGFYIEFAMRLSSNDSDHFTGLFLQTAEHNLAKDDHLSTDPAGFERWTEIDVSEAGYGPGSLATVINWSGIYPHYSPQTFNSYGHDAAMDWTKEHRFGLSYDPATNTLQWYIDDVPTWKSVSADSVMKRFHYFIVMEASSHGSHKDYDMFIRYVSAYTK